MTPTVRFAPSPTGYIHAGNARPAVLNARLAAELGARFVLRLDDTDAERSSETFAEAIIEDLAWLGIRPDLVVRQSERADRHRAALTRLIEAGRVYPCYETPAELDRRRALQASRGLPPRYDRAALRLDQATRDRLDAEGRRPHYRFLLPNFADDPHAPVRTEVSWDDMVRGPQVVDLASQSDPVVQREDGAFLYTLPSVVDDVELAISHVLRGEDHVANTAVQIALFEALGAPVPRFGHHNLLVGADGEPLSKRRGALSLRTLRAEGFEPEAVARLAGRAGGEPPQTAGEGPLDLAAMGRSAARFDTVELGALNARLVHALDWAEVSDRFGPGELGERPAAFWNAIRGNLEKVRDASTWFARLADPARPDGLDRDLLATAAGLLPSEPWDGATWAQWTVAVSAASGRKGKALFQPIRLALTGLDHGPAMAELLPLIGRERTLARLL